MLYGDAYIFCHTYSGKYEMAAQITAQLIELLPGGQAQLAEIYEETEQRRMKAIESTGQVDHDDIFKALCRCDVLNSCPKDIVANNIQCRRGHIKTTCT